MVGLVPDVLLVVFEVFLHVPGDFFAFPHDVDVAHPTPDDVK